MYIYILWKKQKNLARTKSFVISPLFTFWPNRGTQYQGPEVAYVFHPLSWEQTLEKGYWKHNSVGIECLLDSEEQPGFGAQMSPAVR